MNKSGIKNDRQVIIGKKYYFLLKQKTAESSAVSNILKISGSQNKTRTCTAVRPLPPQSSVYTNFTTWAF